MSRCAARERKPALEFKDFEPTQAFVRGDRVRRQVLGDEHVERSYSNTDQFSRAWRQFATESAWGASWARSGLDVKTRAICTVAALIALGGLPEQLKTHIRGALRLGVTREELVEMIIHVGVYAGEPRAAVAFEIARGIVSKHAR